MAEVVSPTCYEVVYTHAGSEARVAVVVLAGSWRQSGLQGDNQRVASAIANMLRVPSVTLSYYKPRPIASDAVARMDLTQPQIISF